MKQNWTYKKIGEVCDSTSNIQWHNEDESYYYVDLSSVDRESHRITETNSVNKDNAPSRAKQLIKTGDILFGTTRPMLKRVCLIDENYDNQICSTGFSVLRPSGSIVSKWVFYHLLSDKFYSYIEPLQNGIAYPAVSDKDVRSFAIPVPPIKEQEEICSLLDKLSLVIEKKKQQVKELDNLAQAIFYDMFGDPVENEKGWEVKSLNDVCDVRDGTHDSPKYIDGGDYILITSKNIVDGKIDYSNINYITKEDYDAINKRSKVDDGDIIMAMIGTIGKPIIVKMQEYKFCIKNVALIKFYKESTVSNIYIKALLSSSTFSQHIISKNQGGTQKFVALGTIRKLSIPIPPLSLQQSFAQKVESIERQKELINQSIREAQTLFDSRMEYYFGE